MDQDLSAGDREEQELRHYLALLSDGEPVERWRAAAALGRLADARGVDPLIAALRDDDWRVREKAAWALGRIGDPRAVRPLRALLRGDYEIVAEIALEAIRTITEGAPPPLR